jgi:type II secretory pathway pseudopilin PulG
MRSCAQTSRHRAAGFSLLEVVVAAAVLLMTITTVSVCATSVARSGARIEALMDADRAVRAVAGRLRELQYCADSYPVADVRRGVGAGDLVATVFPHARPIENTETSYYVTTAAGDGTSAGSFVTLVPEDGVEVRCVARFLAAAGGPELAGTDLDGWAVWEWASPPGPWLSVVLTAESRGATRKVSLTRAALTTPSIDAGWSRPGWSP